MMIKAVVKYILLTVASSTLVACSSGNTENTSTAQITGSDKSTSSTKALPTDVIAHVGDEIITFSQMNTMLNSSAMVGLSVPALGTPERDKVIITLLDKAISANLLYLDALQKGTDKLPVYTNNIRDFENAILASLYQSKVLIGKIPVSDEEINTYYKENVKSDVEFTDDVKLAIESMVRDQKLKAKRSTWREQLRKGEKVVINDDVLTSENDDSRRDSEIVAHFKNGTIVWRDVKDLMRGADKRADRAAFFIDSEEERLERLNRVIDTRIMAIKAKQEGLENDPIYLTRTREYRKTHLINVHRGLLLHKWLPSDDVLKDYYVEHMDSIAIPEARKIQMVLVKTKKEAEDIKKKIDKGEITMYQAAQQYSIDPDAKRSLGVLGWVDEDTGFEKLDDMTFNLEPGEVGGPIESPAGWHLVTVLDVRDAQMQVFDEPQTRKNTLRMYMKDKLDSYVVALRKDSFKVAVDDEALHEQFQNQADFIAQLDQKAQQDNSITKQRVNDLQKWIGKPADNQSEQVNAE